MKSEKAIKAKQNLKAYAAKVSKELEKYLANEVEDVFGVSAKEKKLAEILLEHIKSHNTSSGKRLRASFVYYGYRLLDNTKDNELTRASMSVELVHTGLLMLDDFMDQDNLRRGQLTTHEYFKKFHESEGHRGDAKHFGEVIAVNAGLIAISKGYSILANAKFDEEKKNKCLDRLFEGIANTTIGQSFDILLEAEGNAKEQDILDLHLAKTAIYTYENPLHVGAVLAGATAKDLDILSDYALPGGIAFQLQDDILGLFGNEAKTGKSAHSDLKQGKMTLLMIKAFENASGIQKGALKRIWGNKKLTNKDAEIARRIVIETGSLDYSKKIALDWATKAQSAIPAMRLRSWNEEAVDYLDGIAQYMIERDL